MSFVYVGLDSVVETSRIVAIAGYSQVPIQKLVRETEPSKVVDLVGKSTSGKRKVKSVIITDDNRLLLCSRASEIIANSIIC